MEQGPEEIVKIVRKVGLTPENVRQAAGEVQPFAVGVASGVEKSPMLKDIDKMQTFINEAKAT